MKKLLAVLCLCLCVFLGNAILTDIPNVDAASRIQILKISPEYTTSGVGGWVNVVGNQTQPGKTIASDTIRVIIEFYGAPNNPTITVNGSAYNSKRLVSTSTSGQIVTQVWELTGMVSKLGLNTIPAHNLTTGIGCWNWNGTTKVSHEVATTFQAYADWR